RQILPAFAHRFIFSQPHEFPAARFFVGAGFGALGGAGETGVTLQCLCILGGAFSSYFRCSVLLMIPCMLSSHGRAYVMLFVLYGLYQGPISNIYRNVQDISFSMGCNTDLQIEQSKIMWHVAIDPFIEVVQDIVVGALSKTNSKNVSKNFQNIRDEMMGDYGYDPLNKEPTMAKNSTQEMFIFKTMMRCDYVVEQGIDHCQKWFKQRWQECMDTIKAPLINHILCVPMLFHFLCDIMRVMTPWCRQEIPVGGNFGEAYDKLNDSITRLAKDFTANMAYKKMVVADQLLEVFQMILSCTFIFLFISAFGYLRQYNQDIYFDNKYITTYFRQIDARRRKLGKRYLLPLKKAERPNFIYPWSFYIHSSELSCMVCFHTLFQKITIMIFLFSVSLIYSFCFIFSRVHHVEINVGGQSMLAKLLQRTIRAFNRTSKFDMKSTNRNCLPHPRALSQEDYLWILIPLLMMAVMCCLQVYTNRLRRVIAAFYFPKVKKAWINNGKTISCRATSLCLAPFYLFQIGNLGLKLRWCCVCGEHQAGDEAVRCPVSTCQAVYCLQCWNDLGRFCFACSPYSQSSLDDHGDIESYLYSF
uniref:DC-STAMP domain containing 1 n=1 Tax=Scleropages formosus TaxID=113540 RepID=A0A8C9V2U0_SCLFO